MDVVEVLAIENRRRRGDESLTVPLAPFATSREIPFPRASPTAQSGPVRKVGQASLPVSAQAALSGTRRRPPSALEGIASSMPKLGRFRTPHSEFGPPPLPIIRN